MYLDDFFILFVWNIIRHLFGNHSYNSATCNVPGKFWLWIKLSGGTVYLTHSTFCIQGGLYMYRSQLLNWTEVNRTSHMRYQLMITVRIIIYHVYQLTMQTTCLGYVVCATCMTPKWNLWSEHYTIKWAYVTLNVLINPFSAGTVFRRLKWSPHWKN